MSDLTVLNEKLFELFDSVSKGDTDIKKAQALNATASNIIKNTKTQIDAFKLSDRTGFIIKTATPAVERIGPAKIPQSHKIPSSRIDLKTKRANLLNEDAFAKVLGYEDRLSAIVKLTAKVFQQKYKDYQNTIS